MFAKPFAKRFPRFPKKPIEAFGGFGLETRRA